MSEQNPAGSTTSPLGEVIRGLRSSVAIGLLCLGALAGLAGRADAAAAQRTAAEERARGHIDVVEVSGLVDTVQVDFLRRAMDGAEKAGAIAIVVQLDSGGVVAPRDDYDDLLRRIRSSPVPVVVWVGPSGSSVDGAAIRLVDAAALARRAPGSEVPFHDLLVAPTLGDVIVQLDGLELGGTVLRTAKVIRGGDQPRRQPTVEVRFAKLPAMARLLHTAASPSVAYLLLLAGLTLAVFEFFTAGVGIAAAVAATCVALASYGLAALPARSWALALLGLAFTGFAIDIQAGAPRAWTVIGGLALAAGSLRLFDGVDLTLPALAFGIGGVLLAVVAGMPAMVRARFSTPTIGREGMVGELGRATAAVDPDGTVEVRGAPWRARTNRATPIGDGDPVRVVAIDGLVLEVEPLEGAARDHRK